jgi:hypothetical protein
MMGTKSLAELREELRRSLSPTVRKEPRPIPPEGQQVLHELTDLLERLREEAKPQRTTA